MTWLLKKFDALTPHELYAILQLRNAVFVVEQNCVFQDADDKDQSSWHFMCWDKDALLAYTRIVPPGLSYPEPSIGRVVTAAQARGLGLGRELMERSIVQLRSIYGEGPLKIGAQGHLREFYASLGFTQSSEPYLEDGIEHIEMTLL